MENRKIRPAVLVIKFVQFHPSDYFIHLIVDLGQDTFELDLNFDKLLVILVAFAGLLQNLMEEGLIPGNSEGGLK